MDVTFLPDIAEGRFTFVFASPESVLKPKWRDVFLTETWQTRISLIVIDEAHSILEWGEEFRPEYQQLCQLRSLAIRLQDHRHNIEIIKNEKIFSFIVGKRKVRSTSRS